MKTAEEGPKGRWFASSTGEVSPDGGAKLSNLKQIGEWSEQASRKSEPINANNRNSYSNERYLG